MNYQHPLLSILNDIQLTSSKYGTSEYNIALDELITQESQLEEHTQSNLFDNENDDEDCEDPHADDYLTAEDVGVSGNWNNY